MKADITNMKADITNMKIGYHEHEIRYCATQGKRKNYRT